MKHPKILILRHRDNVVYNYRVNRPLVGQMGAKVQKTILRKNDKKTIQQLSDDYSKKCDILVIKYIDDFHTLDVLYTMRKVGTFKIVIDLDDNLWQIPVGNPAICDANRHAKRIMSLTESCKCADWVTCSTEPLKNAVEPLNSNIVVLPNYIDPKDWEFKRKKHKKIRIGWVWSPTHIPDMHIIEEALREISKRDDVEIVIFGTQLSIFKDIKTTNIEGVEYTEYPKVFMEAGIDISLAPLDDNDFNKSKSNIKWLESTMAGSAFIGSDIYPYTYSVKDGKTGYIAKNTSQWVKKMTYLIENHEKRAEMVKNARKEVLEKYTSGEKFIEFYQTLCKS
jgi:glycosyltransferase involved in cell wall biosynthesis